MTRFYRSHPKYVYGKLVMLKDMNHFNTHEERLFYTPFIIDRELPRLQVYMVTVKKGQLLKEIEKPIKHVALPFWIEVMQVAGETDYQFYKKLLPGPEPIQSLQITKQSWTSFCHRFVYRNRVPLITT